MGGWVGYLGHVAEHVLGGVEVDQGHDLPAHVVLESLGVVGVKEAVAHPHAWLRREVGGLVGGWVGGGGKGGLNELLDVLNGWVEGKKEV